MGALYGHCLLLRHLVLRNQVSPNESSGAACVEQDVLHSLPFDSSTLIHPLLLHHHPLLMVMLSEPKRALFEHLLEMWLRPPQLKHLRSDQVSAFTAPASFGHSIFTWPTRVRNCNTSALVPVKTASCLFSPATVASHLSLQSWSCLFA